MFPLQAHRTEPYVLSETEDYAVVYKPPFIHSVPLKKGEGGTLLDWYGRIGSRTFKPSGGKEYEGGFLHRLDYETEGLVLIAKNQRTMDALLAQQKQGVFVKEYGAFSCGPGNAGPLPGFPLFPPGISGEALRCDAPFPIQSYFRPWGQGRKAVRPVVTEPGRNIAADQGKPYVTEVLAAEDLYFRLRIKRGFRHQIRCHLAWIGKPILNDALYGGVVPEHSGHRGAVALRAQGFSFFDPAGGEMQTYRIPAINA
ncbi:RNA pseudouridine synthase [Spirochaetia bacterium]|nr:RNA pseudouridine synthase [Spirochaetia bacterium]